MGTSIAGRRLRSRFLFKSIRCNSHLWRTCSLPPLPVFRGCKSRSLGVGVGVLSFSPQSSATPSQSGCAHIFWRLPSSFPLPWYSGGGWGWGFLSSTKKYGHTRQSGLTLILGSHSLSPSPCTQGEGRGGGSDWDEPRMCVTPRQAQGNRI